MPSHYKLLLLRISLLSVKEITDGKGVPVVFDGVGLDTFTKDL